MTLELGELRALLRELGDLALAIDVIRTRALELALQGVGTVHCRVPP